MRPLRQIGGLARAYDVQRCLVIGGQASGPAHAEVVHSLQTAGIRTESYLSPSSGTAMHCTAAAVNLADADAAVSRARAIGANAVVGVGPGGILDLAKATAAAAGNSSVSNGIAAHMPGSTPGMVTPLSPSYALPMFLVPTTATVAAMSGRCLLRVPEAGGALLPLVVDGPGPFGVGQGLQPRDVVADVHVTTKQSTRGTAAAAAHALAVFADSIVAAAGTIKAQMLWDDIASGVTSARAALEAPDAAKVDALNATLVAGVAASDSDANARGTLCAAHVLACIAYNAWAPLSFSSTMAALLPPMLLEWQRQASDDAVQGLSALAGMVLRRPTATPEELASWVQERCSDAGLQRPTLPNFADCERTAVVLSLRVAASPLLRQRPPPDWMLDPVCLARIYKTALTY